MLSLRNFGQHPDISRVSMESYADSAEVCFEHVGHRSPLTLTVRVDAATTSFVVSWFAPSAPMRNANRNLLDATENGAYAVAIACMPLLRAGVVSRADAMTGADFYVVDLPARDLEDARRLEVSGILSGTASGMSVRMRIKLDQLRRADPVWPGFAVVVCFSMARVEVERFP